MERLPTLLLPGANQCVGRVLGAGLRGPLTGRSPAVALAGGGVGARPSDGGSTGAGSGGCPGKSPPEASGAGRGGGGSAQRLRRWLRMRQARCAPPRSPPAQRGSATPAAGEAWRPGPGAPARSLCRSGGHWPREVSSNLWGPKQTRSGASLSASPCVSSAPRAARGAPRSPLTLRAAAAIAPGALPGVSRGGGAGRGGARGGARGRQREHRRTLRMCPARGEAAVRAGPAPLRARGERAVG